MAQVSPPKPESPPDDWAHAWVSVFFALACVMLFASGARALRDFESDSAFYAFRRAEQLAVGAVLVTGNGEFPAAGTGSPLWVFALSFVARAGLPVPFVAKLLGFVLNLLVVPLLLLRLWWLADVPRRSGWRWIAAFAPACWLAFSATVLASYSGADTGLAIACELAMVAAVASIPAGRAPSARELAVLAGFFTLSLAARSDAALVGAVALLALFARERKRSPGGTAGALVLGALALGCWRLWSFDGLGPASADEPWRGATATLGLLLNMLPFWSCFLAGVALSPPGHRRLGTVETISLAAIAIHAAVGMREAGGVDADLRLLSPAVPFFLLLAICGIKRIAANTAGAKWRPRTSSFAGIAAVVFLACAARYSGTQAIRGLFLPLADNHAIDPDAFAPAASRRIGSAIAALGKGTELSIDATTSGIIAYAAGAADMDPRADAGPVDIEFTATGTAAIDEPDATRGGQRQSDAALREAFAARAREFFYAGSYRWPADERRRFLHVWMRKDRAGSALLAQSLIRTADTYQPDNFAHGPHPPEVQRGVLLPESMPGR